MDRIVLEVDDNAGEIYRALNLTDKERVNNTVSTILKKNKYASTHQDFLKLLDALSAEAEKNGLTDEILEKLLAGDD